MANIELKNEISKAINQFSTATLVDNGINLFRTLGYETDRQSHLDNCDYQTFAENYIHDRFNFSNEKALTKDWSFVDIMFQLSKEEVLKRTSLFDTKKVDNTIIEAYLFICVELIKEHYSRTELSQITREINKLFPMPVMVLFKYGNIITLSVINRRIHKREASKDVLEKVTLIKDISIESPHRAHIEIFHDLAFDVLNNKFNISNFVELHNAWQKVLDTKELNKKFFSELSAWYFWAAKHFEFPSDTEKNREIRNATSVIRLITRLMFVWFLKEKGLVPQELFDKRNLLKILKTMDDSKSTFYKAILQNLFFATLNTEMGKRKFRSKSSNNRDGNYFIHNVFRYEDYFNSPNETLKAYFENIPFLNGGLFECLDKEIEENGKLKQIRIDGFSDREDNPVSLPNEFFFCEKEKEIDLNDVYDTKNKKYKFRGIIDILNSYKFTIAENTPIEEEIALDPELLGKVFENLLANYNPETQTTARKQTGSFYTPREIVNYMVDESLIAYLEQKLVEQASLLVKNEKKTSLDNKNIDEPSENSQSRMIDLPDSIKEFTITKRNLPHWRSPGSVYFITFRTYSDLILNNNSKEIIANSIKFHDKKKYSLFSFVIMPDHVHIILQPLEIKKNEYYNLSEITHSIKSYSANEINKSENQKSRIVWQHESWDRIIRDENEFNEKMNYILNNPVKKGLIDNGYDYKWYYQVEQASLLVKNEKKTSLDNKNIDEPSENSQSRMIDLPIQQKLRQLVSYSDEPHNFNKNEVETLINSIDNIKILDPACGSGAFPMGILHKLVHILHKLDPKNKLWKQRQIEKASHIDDAKVRDAAIDAIEEAFENNELDYGRKLYLIENCIYGVDIQPIAAQISKLRFFISLIVEQKANSKHDNLGIRPLPNLETKFVAANTLIGLEKEKDQKSIFENPDIEKIKEELRKVRHSYFEARTPKTKEKYRNLDRELREKLAIILEKEHYLDNKNAKRVSSWNPYDQNFSADFFEPEWMFGIKVGQTSLPDNYSKKVNIQNSQSGMIDLPSNGFDIVIGNPPYGADLTTTEKEYLTNRFKNHNSKNKNSAIYFIFVADDLLNEKGINSFIVPKSLSYSQGWNICANYLLRHISAFHDTGKSFENVLLEMVVFVKIKNSNLNKYKTGVFNDDCFFDFGLIEKSIFERYKVLLTAQSFSDIELIKKILNNSTKIWGDFVRIERGLNWQSMVNNFKGKSSVYRGAQLNKYYLDSATDFVDLQKFNYNDYSYQLKPKILNQLAIAHVKNPYPHFYLQSHVDFNNSIVFETISCSFQKVETVNLKFLLAINNSKLFAWLLYKFIFNNAIRSTRYDEQYISKIPCPDFAIINQKPIIKVIDQIIELKNKNSLNNTKVLETNIDVIVFKLYELTYNEVKIVDPGFAMGREEYENFKVEG